MINLDAQSLPTLSYYKYSKTHPKTKKPPYKWRARSAVFRFDNLPIFTKQPTNQMIPFFCKTRKKMADDNKPMKYMRYAIGEIVLVVIGNINCVEYK